MYVTLLFPDRATAVGAAKLLGFWDEANDRLLQGGQTIRPDGSAFSWMIDEIGAVVDQPAIVDADTGEVIAPATYRLGWYVNAVGELPTEVAPYVVPYGSGGRVFAGTEPEGEP